MNVAKLFVFYNFILMWNVMTLKCVCGVTPPYRQPVYYSKDPWPHVHPPTLILSLWARQRHDLPVQDVIGSGKSVIKYKYSSQTQKTTCKNKQTIITAKENNGQKSDKPGQAKTHRHQTHENRQKRKQTRSQLPDSLPLSQSFGRLCTRKPTTRNFLTRGGAPCVPIKRMRAR